MDLMLINNGGIDNNNGYYRGLKWRTGMRTYKMCGMSIAVGPGRDANYIPHALGTR